MCGDNCDHQEARQRRMREAPAAPPADPSRAADMDNASFVATLPPELRREVLLSADEALLNTLPPNLVAEAMVLRERIPHQVDEAVGCWVRAVRLKSEHFVVASLQQHKKIKNKHEFWRYFWPKKHETPA